VWTSLQAELRSRRGADVSIAALDRSPSEYGSSFALENVVVTLRGGEVLPLMFKNLDVLLERAARAKPKFLFDPCREIEVYRRILVPHRLGPMCYGLVNGAASNRHWLFIEKVLGRELWQVGEFEVWASVVRWLARMHRRVGPVEAALISQVRLVEHDAAFCGRWIDRAVRFLAGASRAGAVLRHVARAYPRVVDSLTSMPVAFIHGEFYASNILVADGPHSPAIYPVDWEMAGAGPALLDLAALVSGHWTVEQRAALARAYYDEWSGEHVAANDFERFTERLNCCRLHVAVQWLGWSRDWSPPAEHEHDWLNDVAELADTLNL
jgi:hypothetical protein